MKTNELMIGDWVLCPQPFNNWHRVTAIDGLDNEVETTSDLYDAGDISPIRLTPEILKKNGFVCSEKSSRKPYQFRDGSTYISIIKGRLNARYYEKIGKPMNAMQIDCNYVHELQHALRLCGIEKEIEL